MQRLMHSQLQRLMHSRLQRGTHKWQRATPSNRPGHTRTTLKEHSSAGLAVEVVLLRRELILCMVVHFANTWGPVNFSPEPVALSLLVC